MVEPKPTRVMRAGNLRLGYALTVKVASWPVLTEPTSASSTYTHRRNLARSSATVNRVTACSDAATAFPGSTLRVSTTPAAGARIDDFDRLIWSVDSWDSALSTAARAVAS